MKGNNEVDEVFVEIIDMELYQAKKILMGELDKEMSSEEKEYSSSSECAEYVESTEYSEVSDMTNNIKSETENLVRDRKIPERSIINEVSTTELAIDLAMANLAKQTAVKLQKIEVFLGKIEDKLFKDEILDGMNKSDLLLLYTNTRMMRSDSFRMIREIRKDVDFSSLEANLLSLHAKESMKESENDESDNKMQSLLQALLHNENFLSSAEEEQRKEMRGEEDVKRNS